MSERTTSNSLIQTKFPSTSTAKTGSVHPRRHTRSARSTCLAARNSGPFGPQCEWSILVTEREALQREIEWGQRCLDRRRKELLELSVSVEAGKSGRLHVRHRSATHLRPSPVIDDTVEKVLVSWLEHLNVMLGTISQRIDSFRSDDAWLPQDAEESMFDLLRAAG